VRLLSVLRAKHATFCTVPSAVVRSFFRMKFSSEILERRLPTIRVSVLPLLLQISSERLDVILLEWTREARRTSWYSVWFLFYWNCFQGHILCLFVVGVLRLTRIYDQLCIKKKCTRSYLYGCESWSPTLREERRLRVFSTFSSLSHSSRRPLLKI
jgi:hypothetical protein